MLFKNLNRTREIIGILLKYGFEDVVVNTPLHNLIPKRWLLKWAHDEVSVMDYSRWERIRMAVEELGPTFIKLAQIASNRPDILPEELIHELKKLQSDVKPFPYAEAREIVAESLGRPIDEVFEFIIEKPLGSASIGQVHKARLLDGTDVVVKVRRPGVKRRMHQDLDIIKDLVIRTEDFLKEQGVINAMDAVEAFEKSMIKELDFLHEARSIENFRAFYEDYRNFKVPKAYKELSSERLMVMEYAAGCKINDLDQLHAWGLDPRRIAETGMDIYLTQIFEFGYFHADPHPGNVLVQPDGTIVLLDFGMIGKLTRRDKFNFANVFFAMAQEDPRSMALALKRLALEDEVDDIRLLEHDLAEIIDEYATLEVSESSIEELIDQLQRVMFDYKMRVPGAVFLIFRALAVLEGIGKTLHPNFKTYEFVQPYGRKVMMEQYSVKNVAEDVFFRGVQTLSFLNSIPVELKTILKKTRKGRLRIEIEPKAYGALLHKMDRVMNRFILALVVIFLYLCSTILATADLGEAYVSEAVGLPFLSIGGYVFGTFLGIILLFAVLRTRKF